MIRIRLTPQPIETIPSFVAVSAFAVEEVPLGGLPGRLDALLDGEASRMIQEGRLSGRWNVQAMIASRGRVASSYVLFAGLGTLQGLTLSALSLRVEKILGRLLRTSARSISLGVIGKGARGAGFPAVAAETVQGAMRALAGHPSDLDLTMCEPDPACYPELVGVAERAAFRRAEERGLSLEVEV
ncbi:MAG: hypothetical protein AABZ64_08530 [Nitrospinota bacterium]